MKLKTVVLLFALATLFAGCGDDEESGDSGDGGSAPTKAEFVKEGNAICEKGNAELDAATANFGPQTPPAEVDAFVTDTLVPNVQGQIDDLRELTPPAGDENTVDEMLDTAQDNLDTVEDDPASIRSGDPFAEANQLLRDYGLTVCGSS